MMAPDRVLTDLKRERPEWEPWLAVIEDVLHDTDNPDWERAVPAERGPQQGRTPLLAGATLSLPSGAIRRLLKRLIRTASNGGTAKMATLESALDENSLDVLSLFAASLCQEHDDIEDIAAAQGVDADAFQAVAALLPLPFLHACRRRSGALVSASWVEGYCPLCGAWPAFAEIRGIEQSRFFRCGRCGSEWHARVLHCPYCSVGDSGDHDSLESLVPEKAGRSSTIEACRRCLGYVKIFNRLQGCLPGSVTFEDLASVDLDIAAIEQGYSRPQGAGYPLGIDVTERPASRRFFAWKT